MSKDHTNKCPEEILTHRMLSKIKLKRLKVLEIILKTLSKREMRKWKKRIFTVSKMTNLKSLDCQLSNNSEKIGRTQSGTMYKLLKRKRAIRNLSLKISKICRIPLLLWSLDTVITSKLAFKRTHHNYLRPSAIKQLVTWVASKLVGINKHHRPVSSRSSSSAVNLAIQDHLKLWLKMLQLWLVKFQ